MMTKRSVLGASAMGALALASCLVRVDFYTDGYSSSSSSSSGDAGTLCTPGEVRSCYSGPPGTEGKGICSAGQESCAPDGMSFGACFGEVLPLAENCATPEDEDCDGQAPPCKGSLLWAKQFGDASDQEGRSICADATGNVILTGYFNGSIDFGGGASMSAGGGDAFVAKLDPNGSFLWSRSFGDMSAQAGQGVAVDAQGSVVATGYFNGASDFGGGTLTSGGSSDVFVVKLSAGGDHLWSKGFGGAGIQSGQGVAIDGMGNVLLTGYFNGSIDFGGGALASVGNADVFIAKLSPTGDHVWSKGFGDVQAQSGQAIAVDPSGDVIVVGTFSGAVDFGGGLLASAGGSDLFVVKLSADGDHLWSRSFGDGAAQLAQGVAVDAFGNVIVTGVFAGTVDFGGGPLVSKGSSDLFTVKLDASGAHVWSKQFGDDGVQSSATITVDNLGNLLLTGGFVGSVNFGGGPLASASLSVGDIFVAKLDPSGEHQWSFRFGDIQDQAGQGIAADPAGNVLVTGHFAGSTDFGAGPLMSAGSSDIFVVKLSP